VSEEARGRQRSGEPGTHEGDARAAAAKLAQDPEEGDHDERREDAHVEGVPEDATEPHAAAEFKVAAVVDVRELRLEDDDGEAEVEPSQRQDERVEDG